MKKNSFIPLILVIILLVSCSTKKEIHYFNNNTIPNNVDFRWSEVKIQPNDILSVKVHTQNPDLAVPYNVSPLIQSNMQTNPMLLHGYLVSNLGTINLPVIGEIKTEGLTISELELAIQEKMVSGGYLIKPTVVCRILNAKVTVLGDVRNPGTYTFYENNLTFLQALGLAGDLNINGERKTVRIFRIEGGKQTYATIDLTKNDWFNSPYYFIKPNDVIVVNPNSAKVKSAGVIGNAGNLISIVSVLLSSIIIIKSF